eukprot:Gb_20566 [translate_table: standard]
MPITPVYTWRESPTWVTIDLTLSSIKPSTDDITSFIFHGPTSLAHTTSTECYVKLNRPPYLFQADLFADIDTQKSSAVITRGVVKFLLVKKNEGIWGRLTTSLEKEEALERRKKSLDSATEKFQKTIGSNRLSVADFLSYYDNKGWKGGLAQPLCCGAVITAHSEGTSDPHIHRSRSHVILMSRKVISANM